MLDSGDVAPDFSLSRVDERYATYMLSAATRECPVVLAFVPPDAVAARDLLDGLESTDWSALVDGIAVFAIGVDDPSLDGLGEREYSFPILVDPDRYVIDLYEVRSRQEGDGPRRALCLVNGSTTVEFAWEAADPTEEPPLEDLRSAVAGLREGTNGDS